MPQQPSKTVVRKIAESVVVVTAGVGLMAFGTFGAFTDPSTPVPPHRPGDHGAVTTPESGTVVRAP